MASRSVRSAKAGRPGPACAGSRGRRLRRPLPLERFCHYRVAVGAGDIRVSFSFPPESYATVAMDGAMKGRSAPGPAPDVHSHGI
ncbi:MAG: hypothetical protein ACYS9X_03250 [Planctomycetota bacterium]